MAWGGTGDAGGIVTPEAVHLDFEPAGIGSRSVAIVIDLVIQNVSIVLLVVAVVLLEDRTGLLPGWATVAAVLVFIFLILWGYPVAFETLWRGRTPGKAAMGLRVVTVEGAPVRFRHAAVRAALTLVDFYLTFGAAAVVSILLTERSQRLGDLVAGTIVLRERTGAGRPRVARFEVPPGAESYAATVDAAGLTAQDYAAVRSFLLRAPDLAPAVRAQLAERLATPLAAALGHTPPPGTAPELFLTVAAARYQERGLVQPGRPDAPPPPSTAGPEASTDVPRDGFAPPS